MKKFLTVLFVLLFAFQSYSQTTKNNKIPILFEKENAAIISSRLNIPIEKVEGNEVNDGLIHLWVDKSEFELISNINSVREIKIIDQASSGVDNNSSLNSADPHVWTSVDGDLEIGEQLTIYLYGKNDGDYTSDDGYMTMSFPDFDEVDSYGRNNTLDEVYQKKKNQNISTCDGTEIKAEYALVDGHETGWSANEENYIWAKVTPNFTGDLTIHYKMNIGNVRTPSGGCGSDDQQDWQIFKRTVNIKEKTYDCKAKVDYIEINGTDLDNWDNVDVYLNDLSETFNVKIRGGNKGPDESPTGYLTMSFPNFNSSSYLNNINILDNTPGDLTVNKYYGSVEGGDKFANYVMVEGEANNWDNDEYEKFEVEVRPDKWGTFEIKYRMAVTLSDNDFDYDPSSGNNGPIDRPNYSIYVNIIQSNTLTVNVNNIYPNTPYPGKNGYVNLRQKNGSEWIDFRQEHTDDNERVIFTDLPNGSYYADVTHKLPINPAYFGDEEFWGQVREINLPPDETRNFKREMPYLESLKVFNNSGEDVTGKTVPLNEPLKITAKVTNPYENPNNKDDLKTYISLLIDQNKTEPWDFQKESDHEKVFNSKVTDYIVLEFTPNDLGDYYSALGIYSMPYETYVVTDRAPFAEDGSPLFTVSEAHNIELRLYRLSDISGSKNSSNPGREKTLFVPGETARITFSANNLGESVPVQTVLNILNKNGDLEFDSNEEDLNNSFDSPLVQNETDYYSFDWDIPYSTKPGDYSVGGSIRNENIFDKIYETTSPGRNSGFDNDDWILKDVFTVEPDNRPGIDIPILMYHNIDNDDKSIYWLKTDKFKFQMDYLEAYGYNIITLDDIDSYLKLNTPLPSNPVVLTFDDGYKNFYDNAYPILKEKGFEATNFLITDFVSENASNRKLNTWERDPNELSYENPHLIWPEVLEMQNNGISFGSHTKSHPDLVSLYNQGKISEVSSEISESKEIIRNKLGKCDYFSYPYGSVDGNIGSIVIENNYLSAVDIDRGRFYNTQNSENFQMERVEIPGDVEQLGFIQIFDNNYIFPDFDINDVRILDSDGNEKTSFRTGETITFEVEAICYNKDVSIVASLNLDIDNDESTLPKYDTHLESPSKDKSVNFIKGRVQKFTFEWEIPSDAENGEWFYNIGFHGEKYVLWYKGTEWQKGFAVGNYNPDQIWSRVHDENDFYDVHVVSKEFIPDLQQRQLIENEDKENITDIYVMKNENEIVENEKAIEILLKAQSARKFIEMRTPQYLENSIMKHDLVLYNRNKSDYGQAYKVWIPYATTEMFRENFILTGINWWNQPVGIDNDSYRKTSYREVLLDCILQPGIANKLEDRFESLDKINLVKNYIQDPTIVAMYASILKGNPAITITKGELQTTLENHINVTSDLTDIKWLTKLDKVLGNALNIASVTADLAKYLYITSLTTAQAEKRLNTLKDWVNENSSKDNVLKEAMNLAEQDFRNYLERDFFNALKDILWEGSAAGIAGKALFTKAVENYFNLTSLAAKKALLPWFLSWETYKLIRNQENNAKYCAISATLWHHILDSKYIENLGESVSSSEINIKDVDNLLNMTNISSYLGWYFYDKYLAISNNSLNAWFGYFLENLNLDGWSDYSEFIENLETGRELGLNYLNLTNNPFYLTHHLYPLDIDATDQEYIFLLNKIRSSKPIIIENVYSSFNISQSVGYTPLSINFENTSTGNIESYEWDFDDGEKYSGKNPSTHSYIQPGIYYPSLKVINSTSSNSSYKTIVVNYTPTITKFECDNVSGTAPKTINFTNNSKGENNEYFWSFGDGKTSNEIHPTHTYEYPGSYTVSLTASGPGGNDQLTKTDFIKIEGAKGTIKVITNIDNSKYFIKGPKNISGGGQSSNFAEMPVGEYEITYYNVDKFLAPSSEKFNISSNRTTSINGQYILNNAPILSWVGSEGYENDGLNPESGNIGTNFEFKVKYSDNNNDGVKPGYPRLYIYIDSTEIIGSPFEMTTVQETDFTKGRIYSFNINNLLPERNYNYKIEAFDINGNEATGINNQFNDGPKILKDSVYLEVPNNLRAQPGDSYIDLTWELPGQGIIELSYDDDTVDAYYWFDTNVDGDEYFAVEFSYPSDFYINEAKLLLKNKNTSGNTSYANLILCEGELSIGPNINSIYENNQIAIQGPTNNIEWLTQKYDNVFIPANTGFYIVINWIDVNNNFSVGTDKSNPDKKSYINNGYSNWSVREEYDFMFRIYGSLGKNTPNNIVNNFPTIENKNINNSLKLPPEVQIQNEIVLSSNGISTNSINQNSNTFEGNLHYTNSFDKVRIYKSEFPDSGFVILTETGENNYRDNNIVYGKTYYYKATALYSDPVGESNFSETVNATVFKKPEGVFVFDGELNTQDYSGKYIHNYLLSLGENATYSSSFPNSLEGYDIVFLSYGNWGAQHYTKLNSEMTDKIITYLKNGGSVYLEGGDALGFDQKNDIELLSLFGIDQSFDGDSSNTTITKLFGENGSAASGLDFYSSSQEGIKWIDEYTPNNNGQVMFKNEDKIVGIQTYSESGGRTICFAYTLADLENELSKRDTLFKRIYRFLKSGEMITNVLSNNEIPDKFSLSQNYPNPFNPSTVVNFSIPQQTKVSLRLYDILGKELEVLVDERLSPGNYNIEIDSERLSSGIYFYQIIAGDFVETKKMILMK